MKDNLTYSVDTTLVYEGGKSMNRKDPGNWTGGKVGKGTLKGTNMGIAASAYPDLDIMNLTKAQVVGIYKAKYWDKVSGDTLEPGVDLVTFDYGVNSGTGRALKDLKACTAALATDTVKKLCAKRLSFLEGLKTWGTFGGGWGKRVHSVEAKGLALTAGTKSAAVGLLSDEADTSSKKANVLATAGASHAVGSGTVAASAHAAIPTVALIILGVVVMVSAGFVIWRSVVSQSRATEFKAVAHGL